MKDHDDKPDRARRRLMKMAAYVPAGIVSLSAARAHAGRLAPTASVKNQVGTGVGVSSKTKAGAKVG